MTEMRDTPTVEIGTMCVRVIDVLGADEEYTTTVLRVYADSPHIKTPPFTLRVGPVVVRDGEVVRER